MASNPFATVHALVLSLLYPALTTELSIPVALLNGPFDRTNLPVVWAEVDIHYTDASQIGPSANPKPRQRGFVYVCVYSREGTGDKTANDALAWFIDKLQAQSRDGVQLQVAQVVSDPPPRGWAVKSIKVEFHATGI